MTVPAIGVVVGISVKMSVLRGKKGISKGHTDAFNDFIAFKCLEILFYNNCYILTSSIC